MPKIRVLIEIENNLQDWPASCPRNKATRVVEEREEDPGPDNLVAIHRRHYHYEGKSNIHSGEKFMLAIDTFYLDSGWECMENAKISIVRE